MSNWTVENRLTGEVVYAYGADQAGHFELFPLETFNHIREKAAQVVVQHPIGARQTVKRDPVTQESVAMVTEYRLDGTQNASEYRNG